MTIVTAISVLLTNILTQLFKGSKRENMTKREKKKRGRYVRLLSGVISVVSVLGTAWLAGEALDVEALGSAVEQVVATLVTFAGSQGTYFLVHTPSEEKSSNPQTSTQ